MLCGGVQRCGVVVVWLLLGVPFSVLNKKTLRRIGLEDPEFSPISPLHPVQSIQSIAPNPNGPLDQAQWTGLLRLDCVDCIGWIALRWSGLGGMDTVEWTGWNGLGGLDFPRNQ